LYAVFRQLAFRIHWKFTPLQSGRNNHRVYPLHPHAQTRDDPRVADGFVPARFRMQCRLLVHEEELSIVLTLRDLEQLQEALRTSRSHPTLFPRQVSMEPLHPVSLMEEIRRRAHELYEERGREPGYAEQDWLRAEAEILAHRRADDEAVAA
jgi:hypothetical protein